MRRLEVLLRGERVGIIALDGRRGASLTAPVPRGPGAAPSSSL